MGWSFGVPADYHASTTLTVQPQKTPAGGSGVSTPHRLNDKDAHDIYRVLRAESAADLRQSFVTLLSDDLSRVVSEEALTHLARLFADGDSATGSFMAGRAESGVGSPAEVSAASTVLAADLIAELGWRD